MPRATSVTSATVCGSARFRPARLAIAALAVLAAGAGEARADDAEACATASEQGQELRDQGKLRAALELFVQCAAATCPAIVRNDCAPWVTQVQAKLPTVAFRARDGEGHDITDVRVSVDGEEIAGKLDGRALTMDPGTHTFRFNKAGEPEVTRTLLLREGEKDRLVDVVIGAPPPPSGGFSMPTAGWVLGGLSLAGFGAGIGFGVSAKSAVDDMRATCAPSCPTERVDGARRDLILANVLFGVGGAAIASAAIVVIVVNVRKPSPVKENAASLLLPAAPALRVGAGPAGLSLWGTW